MACRTSRVPRKVVGKADGWPERLLGRRVGGGLCGGSARMAVAPSELRKEDATQNKEKVRKKRMRE